MQKSRFFHDIFLHQSLFFDRQERLFVNHKFFVPFHKKNDKIFEYDNLAKKKRTWKFLFPFQLIIRYVGLNCVEFNFAPPIFFFNADTHSKFSFNFVSLKSHPFFCPPRKMLQYDNYYNYIIIDIILLQISCGKSVFSITYINVHVLTFRWRREET